MHKQGRSFSDYKSAFLARERGSYHLVMSERSYSRYNSGIASEGEEGLQVSQHPATEKTRYSSKGFVDLAKPACNSL